MWTARRIVRELTDADRRRRILTAFWRHADEGSRLVAASQLARALHFRADTIRRMPPEKKAELLAARAGSAEFDETLASALMLYHTRDQREMLAAFLDHWKIPHVNGSIETDDYTPPSAGAVREAVRALEPRFDRRDIAIYLASVGLLMESWREGVWAVVEELRQPE